MVNHVNDIVLTSQMAFFTRTKFGKQIIKLHENWFKKDTVNSSSMIYYSYCGTKHNRVLNPLIYFYSNWRLFLQDCRMPFVSGQFFDHEGQPYCETHYHAKRGSLCAGCHKPIAGRCITAMFKKFHPEHFVCAFCLKQLNKGTFKEQNLKPYCHSCFDKLFG